MNRIERLGRELLEMELEERLRLCRWLERRGMPEELVFFSGGAAEAYDCAKRGGGSSFLREKASEDVYYAYMYACEVDEGPHEVTRVGASKDAYYAYLYAREVDKGPHEVTRRGACRTPLRALHYAEGVDGGYHEDTWAAVKGTGHEGEYRRHVGVPEGV